MTVNVTERPEGIPVRRPNVDLAHAKVERWIVPGDPITSHYLAALSSVFPNGEDFFVTSVRNFRGAIEHDAMLKRKVKGFIGQESVHGQQHRAFNSRLAELGYPAVQLDADLLRVSKHLQRLPKSIQLAITSASEHFTSVLAHIVLGDEQTRATLFPSEEFELLMTWHALEELEHKDVAYDLFNEVSGNYGVRLLGILFASVGFGSVVVRGYVSALVRDRRSIDRNARRQFRHNFARQEMVGRKAHRMLIQYVRPSFHPRDLNTDTLVTEWRDRLASSMTKTAGSEKTHQ
jgi:predicted metal-dependent hydrolase